MHVVKQGVLHRHSSSNSQNHHHHHHHHHHHSNQHGHQSGSTTSETQAGSRPILMTFHDLGMNSELQFANFCERDEVKLMLQTFTIIHVNFIGQEFVGQQGPPVAALPDDFKYPTVEQMAECIVDVCAQLRVRSFIGLAVGAGAHIVSTLALMRPDLVHGLFLINPVLSSCSITEWLYFKMSAIASNHQILGGGGGGGSSQSADDQSRTSDDHQAHASSSSSSSPSSSSSSGFKKLWKAVNHNHHGQPHRHHHQHHSIKSQGSESGNESAASSLSQTPSRSIMIQNQTPPAQATPPAAKPAPASSSRLRQLILSRNFKLGKQQQQQLQQHQRRPASAHTREPSLSSLSTAGQGGDHEDEPAEPARSASAQDRRASVGSQASSNASSQIAYAGKRPPLEYLLYHHFGTASLQRFRRMSSDMQATSIAGRTNPPPAPTDESCEPAQEHNRRQQLAQQHRDSCDSNASRSSLAASTATGAVARQHRGSRDSQRSQDSLTHSAAGARNQRRLLQRSHSVSLEASYLASIASDRQRTAYMQNVYKRYFTQINAHNLWLFSQSFVKRRTLNLRKDCGAAAHAAAAAAALGTSICAAFVGGQVAQPAAPPVQLAKGRGNDLPAANLPPSAADETQQAGPEAMEKSATTITKRGLEEARASSERIQAKVASGLAGTRSTGKTTASAAASIATATLGGVNKSQQQPPEALVAGTKVKRTFTCQTLIMCSSVHIHRERALKLMSLLNPLQATWIKTDQLLVLEEKPEKVCQALRLFLQGIGYSMSTYERRLRLGSAQASISSADSDGSVRSLNLIGSTTAVSSAAAGGSSTQKSAPPVGGGGGDGSASSSPLHQQTPI